MFPSRARWPNKAGHVSFPKNLAKLGLTRLVRLLVYDRPKRLTCLVSKCSPAIARAPVTTAAVLVAVVVDR